MDPLTSESGLPKRSPSLAALVLGILNLVFLATTLVGVGLVWSMDQKWNAAISDISGDQKFRLINVHRTGLFSRHLVVWADGPDESVASSIERTVRDHGLNADSLSLKTLPAYFPDSPAAEARQAELARLTEARAAELAALRHESAASKEAFEQAQTINFRRLSQQSLKARFPVEMEDVRIEINGNRWLLKGSIHEPELATFPTRAGKFLEGVEIDFSGIQNKTESRIGELSTALGAIDLSKDEPGQHLRAKRLMQDLLWVFARGERPEPQFQLVVRHAADDDAEKLAQAAQSAVTSGEFAVTMDQLKKSDRSQTPGLSQVTLRVVP